MYVGLDDFCFGYVDDGCVYVDVFVFYVSFCCEVGECFVSGNVFGVVIWIVGVVYGICVKEEVMCVNCFGLVKC